MSNELESALARPAALCAFCPKMCRAACPVEEAEGRETVTPWGKMSLVHLAREGAVRLSAPDESRALEACTGCGACTELCAHGNPVTETLFVARGQANTERSQRFRAAFEQTGDVKGRPLSDWLERLDGDSDARIAYFPGCTRLDADDGRVQRDLTALSRALAEPVRAVSLPRGFACCGYPLFADGQLDLLAHHLAKLWDALSGHEVVITPDPGCAWTLSVVRRGLGIEDKGGPRVIPLVEVLARAAPRFEGAAAGLEVRYHDPCYLARRGHTEAAPRALLRAATGRDPEPLRNPGCSGGGGLYPTSNPEGANEMARRRAETSGSERKLPVVTACPSATRSFERAGVAVFDIVDVALGAIPRGEDNG